MSNPTYVEMEARLETVEARTDTKIARLEGKIDTLSATVLGKFDALGAEVAGSRADVNLGRTEARSNRLILLTAMLASVLALAGLLYAMITYGDATFGRGMDVQKAINETVREMQKAAPSIPQSPK